MNDVIELEGRWYIRATSALADDRTRVLKHAETFAIFDRNGDVTLVGKGKQGIFHQDTRYLSRMQLRLDGLRPLLLSSSVTKNNALLTVDLTNPDLTSSSGLIIKRETVHLFRAKFLLNGTCYEHLRVTHHGDEPINVELAFEFAGDFVDIFEVRGTKRERHGKLLPPKVSDREVRLGYQGLDGVERTLYLTFDQKPDELSGSSAKYLLKLVPHQSVHLHLTSRCERAGEGAPVLSYEAAREKVEAEIAAELEPFSQITTSNEQFDAWLNCSQNDLRMMLTDTRRGPYPFAGVPWFSTPFGRDGIITALETLWINPTLARGVLGFLAGLQADAVDDANDAEPGKILHEARKGEMSALREVPFEKYYGSIDSTPLFVMLAGEYFAETGDRALVEQLWPNVERALQWIDRWGDVDRDGFVEYQRRNTTGLLQQGWKDSDDSVFHQDGKMAEPPIALCEVQGYVYAAKRHGAILAQVAGKSDISERLSEEAEAFRQKFDQAFWCEELGTYALALDGKKRPCRVRSSNAGHVLYTGLALPERAARLAETLLAEDMFSGWGIRTLSAKELRYNPLSYHNGSIWPHDNALVAEGLARYGHKAEAARVLTAMFEASLYLDLHRLPELFCGLPKRAGTGPTLYPVACAPQAWAAGAAFLMLRSILGVKLDAARKRITFHKPVLPVCLNDVRITGLRAGQGLVDVTIHRYPDDVGVNVTRRVGGCEVVVVK